VSKRELYALVGNKQKMLIAAIAERAKRFRAPADMPVLRDRATLGQVLTAFGTRFVREVSDPHVVAVFRLAIAGAMGETGLMRGPIKLSIGSPAIAHEHARKVSPEERRRPVEAAARVNGIDGVVSGVAHTHNHWSCAPTRQPVSSGTTMKASAAVRSAPNQRKNRSSVLARPCWPIHSKRLRVASIW
jgi:hypothetical protein